MMNIFIKKKNDLMKFQRKKNYKMKESLFNILKLNYLISFFINRVKRKLMIKYAYKKIINIKYIKIERNLKNIDNNDKIIYFQTNKAKKKMKIFFKIWMTNYKKKINKIKIFRRTMLKIKIFKFIKDSIKEINNQELYLAHKFRNVFLKIKFLNMMFRHRLILYRENKLIKNIKDFWKKKTKRLLKKVINNWKQYYKCERFIRLKNIRKKVKIFYILKYLLINRLQNN
jgi:hypothetical protein